MRITTSMMYRQADLNIARRRMEVARAGEQIATGRKLNSLGDDPAAVRRVLRDESALRGVESRRRTVGEAEQLLSGADHTLAGISEATARVRELAVQLANDTYSADDRRAGADELVQIRARLVELGNTQIGERRIFGGLSGAQPPFDATGAYQGDSGALEVPLGPGVRVEATLEGGRPFTDPGGGPSLFATLDALETALRADNGAAVSALIDEARGGHDRVADARQAVGHRLERLENVRDALDRTELLASATLAVERDTSFEDAVTRLYESETGLRAALMMTSRMEGLNLTNFLS